MALTDTAIRSAKPRGRPYKLFDSRGLYLAVQPSGARWWRFKFRLQGREKLLSLGVYDDVSLAKARGRRDQARRLVADGIDPSAARKAERAARGTTFESVALEWLGKQHFEPTTRNKALWMLEKLLFPTLGPKPINSIDAPMVLAALRKTEARGKHESAHRAKWRAAQVFRYAVANGLATHNPVADLGGALTAVRVAHHAAVTDPQRVGELLRAIDGYAGQPGTAFALKLAPLLFARPGELRRAEWAEFDVDGAKPEWRIPASRMKMREAHIVPLATQAVALLRELRPINSGRLLFPSLRSASRPISENTLNAALRRIGYSSGEMTAHGFRTMASTLLNERGVHPDLIELQLSHAERNKVRAAYNRSQRLDERRLMMQDWADFLDGLKAGGNVVTFRRRA